MLTKQEKKIKKLLETIEYLEACRSTDRTIIDMLLQGDTLAIGEYFKWLSNTRLKDFKVKESYVKDFLKD